MSYDIHLVLADSGDNRLESVRTLVERSDEAGINSGPGNPEKEARKQRLLGLLLRDNPDVQPFQFNYAVIAAQDGISEDEARIRYRHIELNGPDDGNGVQITLYDDTADITVPYWHQPPRASIVFEEMWRYLDILEREGGFAVYDPQLDRLLDLATDRPFVLKEYGKGVSLTSRIIADVEGRKKPWWRFW